MYKQLLFNPCRTIAAILLVLSLLACSSITAQPRFAVSKDQLQQELGKRFPLRYPVAGLLNLEVQMPDIRLLPEQNRLSATMVVEGSGTALHRKQTGALELEFALRYEVSDRTLRATAIRFKRLDFPGLRAEASQMINLYGQALSEKSLLEVALHQLRPQDLTMADALGMQPGNITVTDKGLLIEFVSKVP